MFSSIKTKEGNVWAKESLIFSRVTKPANIKMDRPTVERIEILRSTKYPMINPAPPNNWATPVIILW